MKKYLWTILSIILVFSEMNALWWLIDNHHEHEAILWMNLILAVILFGSLISVFCAIKSMDLWSDWFDKR